MLRIKGNQKDTSELPCQFFRIGSVAAVAYCLIKWPPSQSRTTPVVKRELSKKSRASPMSKGLPTRCKGRLCAVFASIAAFLPGSIRSNLSVSQNPGERQLTRSRGPYSSARERVSTSRAPLTVANGTQLMPGRRLSTPATRAIAPPSARTGAMCLQQWYAADDSAAQTRVMR